MTPPQERPGRARIVLLGWYGSDNTGDEAVLEAIVIALRERGHTNLHALSIDPRKTMRHLQIGSSPRRLSSTATLRSLWHSKALILGGGGLIQDRTSVYNLPIYALYVLLARLFGLKVIGWGVGVEPLDTLLGRLLARYIVNSASHFSVRDAGSKRLLLRAGVQPGRIAVSADPAFLIRPSSTARVAQVANKPTIVFCLRDLPNNRPGLNLDYLLPINLRRRIGMGRQGTEEPVVSFVSAIARGVLVSATEFGANVAFLSLWPGRDDQIARQVMEEAAHIGVNRHAMTLLPASDRPAEVARQVANADLLVSMRLHALVFAASSGVPALALAYARKMRGLMRTLGFERWVVEVETRTPSPEEIEMKLRLLWAARQEAGIQAHAGALNARTKATQDADAIASLLQ